MGVCNLVIIQFFVHTFNYVVVFGRLINNLNFMRKFWSLIWVLVIVAVVVADAEVASDTGKTDTLGGGDVIESGVIEQGGADIEESDSLNVDDELWNLEGVNEEITAESAPKKTYFVSNIVDGDTIDVIINGGSVRIRLIGVDTPEVYGGVECFGREASAATADMLLGEFVMLEADESQSDKDKYDRLLRYIFTAGGENVAEKLIRDGFGVEYTYRTDYKYKEAFLRAEAEARESGAGMWHDDSCVVGEY